MQKSFIQLNSEQLMIKQFLLFLLINCTFLCAMDKYQNIKPDSFAVKLLVIAKAYEHWPENTSWCQKLSIKPTEIKEIGPCNTTDSEGYVAHLLWGNRVFCTYFSSGENAGEIWAFIDRLASYIHALPIPQENFFILKSHYEKQRKS